MAGLPLLQSTAAALRASIWCAAVLQGRGLSSAAPAAVATAAAVWQLRTGGKAGGADVVVRLSLCSNPFLKADRQQLHAHGIRSPSGAAFRAAWHTAPAEQVPACARRSQVLGCT